MDNSILFEEDAPPLKKCAGCGQYFDEDKLKRCRVCGEYFCSTCQKTHDCRDHSVGDGSGRVPSPAPSTQIKSDGTAVPPVSPPCVSKPVNNDGEVLVEVSDLSKHYAAFGIEHVSFTLRAGSVMGFIGENGAGKTTTLKTMIDIAKRDSGKVYYFGHDIKELPIEIKKRIAVVFDDAYLHENFTAKQLSSIFGLIYFKRWDEKVFFSYLRKFRVDPNKKISAYSRGMRMKISIAIALSHNPRVLILDEPTSGLDPVIRDEILDCLFEFVQSGSRCILFSTHITSDIDKIADAITFIHNGKIIFSMSKDALLNNMGIIQCQESDIPMFGSAVVKVKRNEIGCKVLVNDRKQFEQSGISVIPATTEEIMLFYVRGDTEVQR